MTMSFYRELFAVGACDDALVWVTQYDDPNEAWHKCENDDWMRWLLIQVDYGPITDRRPNPGDDCGCLPCSMGFWTPAQIRKLIPDYPL